MAKKNLDAREYARRLTEVSDALIIIHSHPDGDAVGSGIALLNILCALGKKACLACCDEISSHLDFLLKYANGEVFFGNVGELYDRELSQILTIDIASPSLVGEALSEYMQRIDLSLDHHEINTLSCEELFIESFSSSAGESLFFVAKELEAITGKRIIDKNTACALYASVSSDSGNFKYSNTGSRTHRCAGELIDLGADNEYISRMLFDTKPYSMLVAESICTKNAEMLLDGKVAFSYITEADFVSSGIDEASTDTCPQILRMIPGVEIGAFARAKGEGVYKLSMRSNEYADVAAFCATLGGGGHKKAAGATFYGTIDEIRDMLLERCGEYLK